ncbi:MAG: SDR family oxidoreductase [Acidobacteria bacterium]|nr:SDR family oxidoreductase [Acidobacteriota bacterium]
MQLTGAVAVITGAARGIGAALARRFEKENPAALVLSDLEPAPGILAADVSSEHDIQRLIAHTIDTHGRIDLFCSNAGILVEGGAGCPDAEWDRIWKVNVMSHVWAARALLPHFRQRGGGYFLQTVSAAGLLTAPGSAPYSVSKHAALAFGEWLAIHHRRDGVKVSCLCPQFVRTGMVESVQSPLRSWMVDTSIPPEAVAETVVEGLAAEQFLILPHPEVKEYFQRKATDYDRWLRGMDRLIREKEGG